jgi:hypothetical protein
MEPRLTFDKEGRAYINGERRAHIVWKQHYPEDDLTRPWVVHHINGNPGDDRIENLQRMTHAEHMTFHQTGLKRSDEAKRKMAEAKRKNWQDPARRQQMMEQLALARSNTVMDPLSGMMRRK